MSRLAARGARRARFGGEKVTVTARAMAAAEERGHCGATAGTSTADLRSLRLDRRDPGCWGGGGLTQSLQRAELVIEDAELDDLHGAACILDDPDS